MNIKVSQTCGQSYMTDPLVIHLKTDYSPAISLWEQIWSYSLHCCCVGPIFRFQYYLEQYHSFIPVSLASHKMIYSRELNTMVRTITWRIHITVRLILIRLNTVHWILCGIDFTIAERSEDSIPVEIFKLDFLRQKSATVDWFPVNRISIMGKWKTKQRLRIQQNGDQNNNDLKTTNKQPKCDT